MPTPQKKIVEPTRGRGKQLSLTKEELSTSLPKCSLKEIIEIIPLVINDIESLKHKFYKDLLLLKLIDENKTITKLGLQLVALDTVDREKILKQQMGKVPKVIELKENLKNLDKVKVATVVDMKSEDFFDGNKRSSKIIYASKVLTWIK